MSLRGFDAALVFSTKYEAANTPHWMRLGDGAWNRRYFGEHYDLPPWLIARLLHGDVVWSARSRGLWTAVLLFSRPQAAALLPAVEKRF